MTETSKAPETAAEVMSTEGPSRDRGIVRTSIIGIVANILLAAFKATVGILSNSIAIVLDAVNNLSDAASSVITIVGTKLAGKKPDRKHPYGYGRVEYLTTIIISVIVLWAGITSLQESVTRVIHPETATYDMLTMVIVAVAVIAKITLGIFTKRSGERLNSGSLVASGTDALMDSVISAATLAAALIFVFTGIALEAWLGAIISLVIIKAGIDMLREVLSKIIGERVDADITAAVKGTVSGVEGVHGAYDLLLDDYGPDRLWGSVHIEVDDTMTAREIDRVTREIQTAVYKADGILLHTVGVYSVNTDDDMAAAMRRYVLDLVGSEEHILELHGFYLDEATRTCSFDLVVSFDAPDRHAVIEEVRADMERRWPDHTFLIALDSDISD